MDEKEVARRKKILEDGINFSKYIPEYLRAKLERNLTPEAREAVLELQLLAIQYGRAVERMDASPEPEPEKKIVVPNAPKREKIENLLVVPGFALPTKK